MAERDTKRKAAGVAEAKAKSPSKKARKEKGDKTEKRDRKRSESGDSTDAPAKRSKEKDVADGAAREEGQGDDAKAEADGDTTEAPKYGEKNAVPQNHKEQKELKLKRKMLRNPHFEMVTQVKLEWEKARSRRVSAKDRSACVTSIVESVRGHMIDVIMQHDSVRVIQTCMQYGSSAERNEIVTELEPHTLALSSAAYGKFMIQKMLVYGTPQQREKIISRFYGSVRKLIKHRHAAAVLALAYADYASSDQRASMLLEFYGPKYALFKGKGKVKSLDDILEAQPDKKGKILEHIKTTLTPLLEKGLCAHHIVHRALYNYLRFIPPGGNEFSEMLEAIKELLVEMVHTKDGAKITAHCIWGADAKTRKLIVRSFKPYVTKVCTEEDGHSALMALFDVVDDTVLMSKSILAPMLADIGEIGVDKFGQQVLLYLLAPRSHKYFGLELRTFLETGDGNAYSKKDTKTRQEELRASLIAPLAEFATKNAGMLVGDGQSSQLLFEIINAQAPDSKEMKALLTAVAATARDDSIKPLSAEDAAKASTGVEASLLGHAVGHRFAKKVLEKSNPFAESFARMLVSEVDGRIVEVTNHNRACFVLLSVLEGEFPSVQSDIERLLRKAGLESKEPISAGAKIILKVLSGDKSSGKTAAPSKSKSTKKKGSAKKA